MTSQQPKPSIAHEWLAAHGIPVQFAPQPVVNPGDAILTIGDDVTMGNEDVWARSADRSVAFFEEVHTGRAYEVARTPQGTTAAVAPFDGVLRRAAMRRSGILPQPSAPQGPALFSATGLPAIADEATGR